MTRFAFLIIGGLLAANLAGCCHTPPPPPAEPHFLCVPYIRFPGTTVKSPHAHYIDGDTDLCSKPQRPVPLGPCPVDPGKPGGAQEKVCSKPKPS